MKNSIDGLVSAYRHQNPAKPECNTLLRTRVTTSIRAADDTDCQSFAESDPFTLPLIFCLPRSKVLNTIFVDTTALRSLHIPFHCINCDSDILCLNGTFALPIYRALMQIAKDQPDIRFYALAAAAQQALKLNAAVEQGLHTIREMLFLSRTPSLTQFVLQEFIRHMVACGMLHMKDPHRNHGAVSAAAADSDASEAADVVEDGADDGSDEEDSIDGELRTGTKKAADSKMCCVPLSIKNVMLPMLDQLMTKPEFQNRVLVHCPDFLASALFKVEYTPVVNSTPGLFSSVGNNTYDDDS